MFCSSSWGSLRPVIAANTRKTVMVDRPSPSAANTSPSIRVTGAPFVRDERLRTGAELQLEMLTQWFAVSQAILRGSDQRTSLFAAATGIRKLTGADQVAIAVCDSDRSARRLVAISDVESFDSASSLVKQIELAACAPLDCQSELSWSRGATDESPQPVLQRYCVDAGHESCFAAPLVTQGATILGSILIGGRSDLFRHSARIAQLKQMIEYLGDCLGVSLEARAPLGQRVRTRIRRWVQHRWTKIAAWAAAGFATAMLIPLPYTVQCDCQLWPTTRRFVSAPFEGVLHESLVQPGDLVSQGQVLARLDGRALRMKLAGLEAQLSGESKRHKSALARNDISESQIAQAECSKLANEIEALNNRLKELNISSPIDGIVVTGDLDKVQGARLETGQSLFEIAPLDQMRAEVAIPETEIRFVRAEMSTRVLLNAYPYQSWTAPIRAIRPRAEIRDNASVFVADVVFDNDQNQLRPGMKGQARVRTDYRLLGWIFFHRFGESLRRWFFW